MSDSTQWAGTSFISAVSSLLQNTDLTDMTVSCGGKEWKVHSAILALRSPFFQAAITNNMKEKREMKIDIKELDEEATEEVIKFMYGKNIGSASIQSLFEAAERFQMKDLKENIVKLARGKMSVENVIELGHLAEVYNMESFLGECAEFIVENNVEMDEEDLSPKLTVRVLRIYKEKAKTDNKKEAKGSVKMTVPLVRPFGGLGDPHLEVESLMSLVSKLKVDTEHTDLTIICGSREFKVHAVVLAARSPFFKAVVNNIMAEKLDMEIKFEDFDPEAVEAVLGFVYGVTQENVPIKFLFQAAQKFQMDDLKKYVVMLARETMSLANAVEYASLAELYNCDTFLGKCSRFIAKNDVLLNEENMSPKLAKMVVTLLKKENLQLREEKQKLRVKEVVKCYEDLAVQKVSIVGKRLEWGSLHNMQLNGHVLEHITSHDVHGQEKAGLSQAAKQLTTQRSYFEIEIIFPGADTVKYQLSTALVIGLNTKDSSRKEMPGNDDSGSIGYYTDMGDIKHNSTRATRQHRVSPICKKGDIIGCGVIFPDAWDAYDLFGKYEWESDLEEEQEQDQEECESSSNEDEDEWQYEDDEYWGDKVLVYFTINGKVIGKEKAVLPHGGFFPAVGMFGDQEYSCLSMENVESRVWHKEC